MLRARMGGKYLGWAILPICAKQGDKCFLEMLAQWTYMKEDHVLRLLVPPSIFHHPPPPPLPPPPVRTSCLRGVCLFHLTQRADPAG